jgi:hypothetical protein
MHSTASDADTSLYHEQVARGYLKALLNLWGGGTGAEETREKESALQVRT